MACPPSLSSESTWIVDPVRDFLSFRLIQLAEAAVLFIFTDDVVEQRYRDWLSDSGHKPVRRRKAAKGATGPDIRNGAHEIHAWRRQDGCVVRVLAVLERGNFAVVVEEEHFSAEVLLSLDLEAHLVRSAGIIRFSGDRLLAAEAARQFVDMLDALGVGDSGRSAESGRQAAALVGLLGTGLAEADVQSFDLLDLSVEVATIANRMAEAPAARGAESVLAEDEQFLAATPEALWAIRDGFIERAAGAHALEPRVLLVWQNLLEKQLEEIRFKAERNHAWALAMIERYQADLLMMAQRPGVDINTWQALVIALDRAKIEIRPEVRAASLDLAAGVAGSGPAAVDIMRSMEEIVESGGGDPFRIAGHLFDIMTMMPADFANIAVTMISEAPLPALRDVLPLVLLVPDAGCRGAAAAALEQMAAEKRLTPAGLRRLIALRSWLPDAERRRVDLAIRRARLAGVDCAAWPSGQLRALHATVIDGSGCQSLVAVAKDGTRNLFAGILTKQSFGVRDVMAERNMSRREADAMLAGVGVQVLTRPVARPYLDRMVQHALWTGVSAGRVPPLALLEVAEVLGCAEWRAERLDPVAEVGHLLAGAAAGLTKAEALNRSAGWTGLPALFDSWFEDDEQARDICARHGRSRKKATAAILSEVIAPHRALWAERLVWVAHWAKAGGQVPGAPDWAEFALVAQALYDGTPVENVPFMEGIARLTVAHAT